MGRRPFVVWPAILVIGGSQGARALNEVVPEAIAMAKVTDFDVVHQAGRTMSDVVEARYKALGVRATVVPFIEDMVSAYASAALVIARSGATTIAELCAVGRPSIVVPFAAAAADHQTKNAVALRDRGAAILITEKELAPERLAREVQDMMTNVERRGAMADAARALGRPDAAAAIVDDLCEWIGCPGVPTEDEDEADDAAMPSDVPHRSPSPSGSGLRGSRPYIPARRLHPPNRRSTLPEHRRPVFFAWEPKD